MSYCFRWHLIQCFYVFVCSTLQLSSWTFTVDRQWLCSHALKFWGKMLINTFLAINFHGRWDFLCLTSLVQLPCYLCLLLCVLTSDKRGGKCVCPLSFVCLSVWARLLKNVCMIWMKCCMSTDVGTWTNWLTFEPDLDCSLDVGNTSLSLISYALQCGILLHRESPTCVLVAAARRGIKMVLFTASRGNTFVGGTCALPSVF